MHVLHLNSEFSLLVSISWNYGSSRVNLEPGDHRSHLLKTRAYSGCGDIGKRQQKVAFSNAWRTAFERLANGFRTGTGSNGYADASERVEKTPFRRVRTGSNASEHQCFRKGVFGGQFLPVGSYKSSQRHTFTPHPHKQTPFQTLWKVLNHLEIARDQVHTSRDLSGLELPREVNRTHKSKRTSQRLLGFCVLLTSLGYHTKPGNQQSLKITKRQFLVVALFGHKRVLKRL